MLYRVFQRFMDSRRIDVGIVLVIIGCLLALGFARDTAAQLPDTILPGKLAIYYGFPSAVNAAVSINDAVTTFGAYDIVVFGDTLQLPQDNPSDPNRNPTYDKACEQNAHLAHDNTVQIIAGLVPTTAVYGYVSLGGENTARYCDTNAEAAHARTLTAATRTGHFIP